LGLDRLSECCYYLEQKFDFRDDFFGRLEVVASVEVGQLAVTTGEEVAALAKVGQLFGLKKKRKKG
jgi:hypothetical protein